jgi:outer membrane murein-binding lipoprotein Lpp
MGAVGGLVLLAAAGCSSPGPDERLAALESEVKALRTEIDALKAHRPAPRSGPAAASPAADPLAGLPGRVIPPPDMRAKLAALHAAEGNLADDDLREDVDELTEKIEKLEKAVRKIGG